MSKSNIINSNDIIDSSTFDQINFLYKLQINNYDKKNMNYISWSTTGYSFLIYMYIYVYIYIYIYIYIMTI